MGIDWVPALKWLPESNQRHHATVCFFMDITPRGHPLQRWSCSRPSNAPSRESGSFVKHSGSPFFSTDLNLTTEQIIEYYGSRWKIESGFKEIKQDIGSGKIQARNAYAVMNHMNFSMMAVAITWIYGTRLENISERRHKVRGRNRFAFSDLRHIIAKAALTHDFDAVCRTHDKLPRKSFVDTLLRMIA
jgi:transposase